jgi:hypothetical protein
VKKVFDEVFELKEVFLKNLGLYYKDNNKLNRDISMTGVAEYPILPQKAYNKN